MIYFSFKGDIDVSNGKGVELVNGGKILLSRTGYTGEFGFELFFSPENLATIWRMMLDIGKEHNLIACGLAARDSLRAGAVLPLSHQDIGTWPYINHPWPFALPFDDDEKGFTKSFLGDEALKDSKKAEYTYPFVGYDLRKVACCRQGGVEDAQENIVGHVLTCVSDMGIGRHEDIVYSLASPYKPAGFSPKGLSCGFIRVSRPFQIGETVTLKDDRRAIAVQIVKDIRPDRTARRPMKKMLD
jgi:aminomethyltransferase